MDRFSKSQFRRLVTINLDDMRSALGWQRLPAMFALARPWLRPFAAAFARRMVRFDAEIRRRGLAAAAADLGGFFAKNLRVIGRDRLPEGPVLFVSNHPGMVDTVVLFQAIDRPDLRIIAAGRPFLQALPA